MVELARKIAAERENIERTLEDLKEASERNEKTVIELAAMATFLHNIYNGIENILKQILKSKGIEIPRSATWHKDLIDIASSNGVISKQLSDELFEYLSFRHFFVHAYSFRLDEIQLMDLSKNINDVWSRLVASIKVNSP